MAACKNRFLFDEEKLHGEIGFFEKRSDMTIFMLNVILNIQHFLMDHCKYDGLKICLVCKIADIYKEKTVYEIYKNCLDLDFFKQGKRKSPPEFEQNIGKTWPFFVQSDQQKILILSQVLFYRTKVFLWCWLLFEKLGKIPNGKD